MIVVATRQSASPRRNSSIVRSSSRSSICPWASAKRTPGHSARSRSATSWQRVDPVVEEERLAAALRPRARSPGAPAPRRRGRRRCGSAAGPPAASRSPRCRAARRGSSAGSAGSASPTATSTSTLSFSWRRSSFWRTPKRCSSSTISRPSSAARTSRDSSRWVPIRMSTLPSAKPASVCADLGRAAKARDHLDLDREVRQALAEGPEVLLGEDRRRHQHHHLLAVRCRPCGRRAARPRSCRSRRRRRSAGPSAARPPCRPSPPRSPRAGRPSRDRGRSARASAATRRRAGTHGRGACGAPRRG